MKLRFNMYGVAVTVSSMATAALMAAGDAAQRDAIAQLPTGSISTYGIVGLIAITSVGSQIAAVRDMSKRLATIEGQRYQQQLSIMKEFLESSSKAATANTKLTEQVQKLIEEMHARPCQQTAKHHRPD